MRALMVGIVVALGLIWSVAAMSNLVPVDVILPDLVTTT